MPEHKRMFTVTSIATRTTDRWGQKFDIDNQITTNHVFAASEDEAYGATMREVRRRFPSSDGWGGHDVGVREFTRAELLTTLAQMGWTAPRPEAPDPLLGIADLPPLPWSSPADRQPWPDGAGDPDMIVDANGAPVLHGRNWKDQCAAIEYLVRRANAGARAAVSHDEKTAAGSP